MRKENRFKCVCQYEFPRLQKKCLPVYELFYMSKSLQGLFYVQRPSYINDDLHFLWLSRKSSKHIS